MVQKVRTASSESSSIRVLEIVADGSPGGGTTHVLQILRGLRDKVSLGLVTQRNSYLLKEARGMGIPSFGMEFFRSRLDFRVPFSLARIVRDFEPGAVHAHGGRGAFFYALARIKAPLVYTVHGYHFVYKAPPARWLALNAERLIVRRAEEVVFVSEYDARLAKKHGILRGSSRRSNIIRNGISSEGGSASKAPEPGHVGFIGRLEFQKDPLLFLHVMEQLPGYTASIVGGGTLEGEVQDRIRREGLTRVEFLGALSHEESLEVLSRFYVLVMTSRWEGLPILPLEAMRAGVPVVTTNVGAMDEIIEDGESGILVDRSPQKLSRAVERLVRDRRLRERIVENGRRRVSALFSEERMMSGILDVYRRVAER